MWILIGLVFEVVLFIFLILDYRMERKFLHGNSSDTPTYHQAMNGPDHNGYSDAMDVKIITLKDKMNDWDIVTRTQNMYVLPSTWTFRCK